MKKIDSAVIQMTVYVTAVSLVLSGIMQAVFLALGFWDLYVLFGNILGIIAAVGNFFLMGLTVQNALGKDKKEAAKIVKLSQSGRLFMLFAVALIGFLVPIFNIVAVVIPFIFPRIGIAIRPVFIKE